MGTPVLPPPEIGINCPVCDPELWTPDTVPRFVKAQLTGLIRCPASPNPAPNGLWVLKQVDGLPCDFILLTDDYSLAWNVTIGGSGFEALHWPVPSFRHFIGHSEDNCEVSFINTLTNCEGPGIYSHSGTVQIYWP